MSSYKDIWSCNDTKIYAPITGAYILMYSVHMWLILIEKFTVFYKAIRC
nr:MAG TPA: hypothetical protein [Caudoviricetes sp.]